MNTSQPIVKVHSENKLGQVDLAKRCNLDKKIIGYRK